MILLLTFTLGKPITMSSIRELHDLVGEEIAAICFVRDYVEFHFDGPILRAVSAPAVIIRGVTFRFPETGSRDALCQLIGASVKAINMRDHMAFELVTVNNDSLVIPLDPQNRRGGEAMHFVPGLNQPIRVW